MNHEAPLSEAKQRLLEIQKQGGLALAPSAATARERPKPEDPVPLSFPQEQVLHWPNEVARPARQTYRGAIYPFLLTRELTESLRDLGKQEGVTLFMILLSSLMTLLQKYTSQQDIIIGTCRRRAVHKLSFSG